MRRFCIVVVAHNTMPWLRRCLESIASQDYPCFDVAIVDDASTQLGQREVMDHFVAKRGWRVRFNERRVGCLANTVRAIEMLECAPEDIIVSLDGDDWFPHTRVLDRLGEVYAKGDVKLTYGQYMRYPSCEWGHSRPLRPGVHKKQRYRDISFRTSALRSFEYDLWSRIEDRDLRSEDGEYYTHATDLAFMFPMLEMARGRIRFLDELLYIYNRDTPFNEDKGEFACQEAAARRIRSLSRYQPI